MSHPAPRPEITAHAVRTNRSHTWPGPTPDDITSGDLMNLARDNEYAQVIGWTEDGEVVMITWVAGEWHDGDHLPAGAE